MHIRDDIVNKKLEQQTTKLDEVVSILTLMSIAEVADSCHTYQDQSCDNQVEFEYQGEEDIEVATG